MPDGERLRTGQRGVFGEFPAQRRTLCCKLFFNLRDGSADCFSRLGVGFASCGIELTIVGGTGAHEILFFAHELGELAIAFSEAGGQGGERIGGGVLQAPLCQGETLCRGWPRCWFVVCRSSARSLRSVVTLGSSGP